MIRMIRLLMLLSVCMMIMLLLGRPLKARAKWLESAVIGRPFAVVIVSGNQLEKLVGVPIDRLRVYRLGSDGFKPIPFQVDQRDDSDRMIFPLGPDPIVAETDRLLDENDELVLMAFDAGAVVSDGDPFLIGKRLVRVTISDSVSGAAGEIVIFEGDGEYPLSPEDYVSFDEAKHLTTARGYELGSRPEAPATIEHMTVTNGRKRVNILDRMKFRGEAYLLMRLFKFRRDETDLLSSLRAYIDGPVRVIRQMDYALRAVWNFNTPSVRRETPAYAYHTEFPNDMNVPFKLSRVFTDVTLQTGFDFRPEMGTARLYTDAFSDPVIIDGKMSENEMGLGRYFPTWFAVEGDFGCMMFLIVLNDELRKTGVSATLRYMDDINIPDPPETVAGSYGSAMYEITNVLEMPKGLHKFNVVFYFTPDCRPGLEADALVDLRNPLQVQVLH